MEAREEIQEAMKTTVNHIFSKSVTNFLSLEILPVLNVVKGDNFLPTCFQYAVKDADGDRLLNVKVYDKILDLCSREGIH